MLRRLSLLLAFMLLAACSQPFANNPDPTLPAETTIAVAPSTEPITPEATPTTEVALTTQTLAPEVTAETATPEESSEAATPAITATPDDVQADGVVVDDPDRIGASDPAERDQTALVEAFKNTGDLPDVARTTPLEVQVGDAESFWVTDAIDDTNYVVTATLRYAGSIVLMYVDNAIEVEQSAIEESAKTFEEEIYPRNQALFGKERSPGVDGDTRLTVLNTPVRGAGGYFSSADGVVEAVNRYSNEREMFVIATDSYPVGTDAYASTLAHEFQHMIEYEQAPRSPSWFNEGMSTLAEDLNGFGSDGPPQLYLANPDIQLNTWSSDAAQTGEHYGTSQLFMRYVHDQYAGDDGLAELIRNDAGNHPEAFAELAARTRPDIETFADLYADWAVANVVNDPSVGDGRYAYELLPELATPTGIESGDVETTVNQFGVDYLGLLSGPLSIAFNGEETIGLTGAEPVDGAYMWWSKRGDDSASTLTHAFDLTGVEQATLEFSTWYEIELDWDYGFVSVSTNGGDMWTSLEGTTTTTTDPQGANLGNGITGVSGAPGVEPDKGTRGTWVEERIDLTPFAGQQILLRFWLVQDAAYNAQGWLLDNIRIPEIDFEDDAEEGDGDWEAQGFVRTTGTLEQLWELRLIRALRGEITVDEVSVDDQGRAEVSLADGERGLLAVMGTTLYTTEPATYTYRSGAPARTSGGAP